MKKLIIPKNNKMPNIFQRAVNFIKALWEHVSTGMKLVSRTKYIKRLNICNECDKQDKKKGICTMCGCYLLKKANWKSSDCPLGKW
tara:strand:- start:1258 stop:1515 length:258 start_codon:yes stop_codon:yes gene_type:complete